MTDIKRHRELVELVTEAKTSAMMLMRRVLDEMVERDRKGAVRMARLQDQGWVVALEISLDAAHRWKVLVTAVSSEGRREVVADVAVASGPWHIG